MKIIIIGSGIAGLSFHHFLLDKLPSADVISYESHKRAVMAIGGGLGLAPNGVHVLSLLSKKAHDHCISPERSYATPYFELRNSKGVILGHPGTETLPPYHMTKRHVIYDAVRDALEEKGGRVVYEKKLQTVREVEGAVEVTFESGEVERCDLLVGADGMKSIVREVAFNGKFGPQYQQLAGIGGFIPARSIPAVERARLANPKSTGVVMTFGADGFFGYSPCDGLGDEGEYMWWSTSEMATPPAKGVPLDREKFRTELLERHKGWVSPDGASVIKEILEVGTSGDWTDKKTIPNYQMPKVDRYGTASGRIMLIGDAAHIMPPHTGQGASQALEDSYALSTVLSHVIKEVPNTDHALKRALDVFSDVRRARVHNIQGRSEEMAKTKKRLSWWQEWVRDWVVWLMCKFTPNSLYQKQYGYRVDDAVEKHLKTLKI